MARGWTWINENDERSEAEIEQITPTLDALAAEWSQLHDQEESEGFRRQAAYEDGDDPGDHFDTDEEYEAWKKQQRTRRESGRIRLEIVEEMLARHGARMMRPYEHWNEDESYMQYMECDRFGESCY